MTCIYFCSRLHCPTIGLCGLIVSLLNYFAAEVAAVYDDDAEMFAAQMVDPVVDYLAALVVGCCIGVWRWHWAHCPASGYKEVLRLLA